MTPINADRLPKNTKKGRAIRLKGKVTVDGLLARSDVRELFDGLNQAEMDGAIVVWYDREGVLRWKIAGLTLQRLVYAMEVIKVTELTEEE